LAERLRPRRLDDLIGNSRARAELRAWAESWKEGRTPSLRATILYGPAGVGKTTAALALAAEYGWTLVEMNASDARNETSVEQVAGRAAITHTLAEPLAGGGRRRALILLDEADSLTGRLADSSRPKPAPSSLREFLRGRYRTVESLNLAYGLRPGSKPAPFEDWEAIPRSPGNAGWARLPVARRDIEEWRDAGRSPDLSDRGGMGAIARLVRSTRQPIVLTVNDERELLRYSAAFRTAVRRIRFYPVRDDELRERLESIVRSERFDVPAGAVDAIVRRSRGDVRAALNDLDQIAAVPASVASLSVLGARDLASDFAAVTEEVLTRPRFYRSVEIRDRLDAPPDDLLPWIEENLPHFSPDAVHRDAGYAALRSAAQFLDRARRARVWSLWSYGSEVMTGGVSLALHDRPVPAGRGVSFPQFLGEMGRSRATRALRDSVATKAGARFHLSRRKTREWVLPFLEEVLGLGSSVANEAESRNVASAIVRELDLTPEELAYLIDSEVDSPGVVRLLATPAISPESISAPSEPRELARDGARSTQRQLTDFGE
jgi:DNA polymerase III delta prime subunit